MRWAAANSNAPQAWSPCSCVTRMALTREGSSPSRARRLSVSVSASPQSTSTTVPAASATRQLPELPLASEAKRKGLLQLLMEQREDALRGLRALGRAVLVEDVDLAGRGSARVFLTDLN